MLEKKSDIKRKLILLKAKQVFINKGFAAVTMKDIVDECKISRGGIYIYFSSVDEVFMQVIIAHNEQKIKEAHDSILGDKTFNQVIDEYFDKQKQRLLNMHNSLLMALYEYRFAHKKDYDKVFFDSQMSKTKAIIHEILSYGVKKGELADLNIDDLAMTIMFFIEGISIMRAASNISEDIIDSQIALMKVLIFKSQPVD